MKKTSSNTDARLNPDASIHPSELDLEGGTFWLSPAKEHALALRMAAGDQEARRLIFECFRPFARSVAQQFYHRWPHGLEEADLIQEAYLGLNAGLDAYDVKRGTRISTCVILYIKKAVHRANDNFGRLVRVPVNQSEKLRRYFAYVREMEVATGRPPALTEAAAYLGIPLRRLTNLVQVTAHIQSLDAEYDDGGERQAVANRFADAGPNPEQSLAEAEVREALRLAVERLEPRDRAVLVARFDLDGRGVRTLEQVAHSMGLTRERVRQLQERALERLRMEVEARVGAETFDVAA
jgi:RNA polymerase sigma factor (sigma-70 family)